MTEYTLGSLFDGSGTFPLAAQMCGITPVWALYVMQGMRAALDEEKQYNELMKMLEV